VTREDVELLQPGPAADALVARCVGVPDAELSFRLRWWRRLTGWPLPFSTDPALAVLVMAGTVGHFNGWRAQSGIRVGWVVTANSFGPDCDWVSSCGDSLPHALCRTILLWNLKRRPVAG
jgi:hypothetical protein